MQKSILLLFIFLCQLCFAQEKNLFDEKKSLEYANYLFRTGDYKLAGQEYERLLYMTNYRKDVLSALLESYERSRSFTFGLNKIEKLYPSFDTIPFEVSRKYAKFSLLSYSFDRTSFLIDNANLSSNEELRVKSGMELLKTNWKEAYQLAEKITDDSTYNNRLLLLANKGMQQKYKSPGLAMAMSALIPGTGKIYTGRWKDGLISLVSIGVLSWQSYRGFNRNGVSSIYGWVNGGLALAFYSGNVYGAHKSAREYNHKLDSKLIYEIENTIYSYY